MKIDKRLLKTVNQLVDVSVDQSGQIDSSQMKKSLKILTSLSSQKAIVALSWYLKGVKRETKKHILEISSVIPVSTAQINKIKSLLKSDQHIISKTQIKIDPSLLGGIKLKIADWIYENSVVSKITSLKEHIYG